MFTDVYYSNFWYSRFYRPIKNDFDGNIIIDEFNHHARCMRVLAMFFDKIYVPRTHLLTFRARLQEQINRSVFEHKDFGFLYEAGVIAISSFPGIDAKQDNERIIRRSGETKRVVYPDEEDYINIIPIDSNYKIDSLIESESNAVSFPKYAEILALQNPKLSKIFQLAVDRSSTEELPFYHEEFLHRLHEKLKPEDFEKIWRETNSIYLTSGAIANSCVAFFNEELESLNFCYQPNNFDRYLFSPSTLLTFLRSLFTDDEIQKILYADIEDVHGYLRPDALGSARSQEFKKDYQVFSQQLSNALKGTAAARTLDQQIMSLAIDAALRNKFRSMTSAVKSVLKDIEQLSRLGDFDGSGLAARVGSTIINRGMGMLQRVSLLTRYPGFLHFSNMVKGQLNW